MAIIIRDRYSSERIKSSAYDNLRENFLNSSPPVKVLTPATFFSHVPKKLPTPATCKLAEDRCVLHPLNKTEFSLVHGHVTAFRVLRYVAPG